MKELLNELVGLIVSDKEKVRVEESRDSDFTKYFVTVGKNDTKCLIGREGKTIKAIRSLVGIAAINRGIKKKIPVEIVEE